MSDPTALDTGDLLDFSPDVVGQDDVSSTTPSYDDSAKDEPSPEGENVPDGKEETPAVEDLVSAKVESEEKPEEPTTKGELRRCGHRWLYMDLYHIFMYCAKERKLFVLDFTDDL